MKTRRSTLSQRTVRSRVMTPALVAVLALGVLLPSSQAGPRYGRGGFGFGSYGWSGCRSYGGWYSGSRFYSGYGCSVPYRSYYRCYSPSYYPSYYRSYYPSYYGPGWGSCDPTPFPYYTPRIYVVPQPPRYSYGPAVRNVVVLPQSISDIEAVSIPPLPINVAQDPAQLLRPQSITVERAWGYLDEGKASMALRSFAHLATSAPENGAHKVGYGLAAALAGDKITANYALRLAFESDPESADKAPIGNELKVALKSVADQYRQAMAKQPKDLNVRFLYAAVSHFIDDDAAARQGVADAMALGDLALSTANLRRLVEAQDTARSTGRTAEGLTGSTLAVYSIENP